MGKLFGSGIELGIGMEAQPVIDIAVKIKIIMIRGNLAAAHPCAIIAV